MLTLVDRCSRRELLRIGAATVGGLTLPGLLAAQGTSIGKSLRNRSVVVLNLQGGPTQFETFDPKPDAPHEIRSITGDMPTSLPGVAFGGTFPQLSKLANCMAVVRSYRHGISSHGPAAMHVMAGGNPTGAMMGALFARVAGLTNPVTGMPHNALVTAPGMGPEYKGLYVSVDRVSQTGTLASAYRPFDPSAGGEIIENMHLNVQGNRLDDRKSLLTNLDQLRRRLDDSGQMESAGRFQQQAFDVLGRGVADAFDLSKENPKLVER